MAFLRAFYMGRSFAASMPTPPCRLAGRVARHNHRQLRETAVSRAHNYSTGGASSSSSSSSSVSSVASRAERILARLPPSLQRYARRLRGAPVSHVVAFLVLHEVSAIVPLVGLFGLFHYAATDSRLSRLVPLDYMAEHYGDSVASGVRRFEKYFRRKGWFGFGPRDDDGAGAGAGAASTDNTGDGHDGHATATATVLEQWASADAKYKIVVEVGLAYAVTKLLLPVRIAVSLWATPWFAGVLTRMRILRRPKT